MCMDMPKAPKVRNMMSFSVLTPYYDEEVLFSLKNLQEANEDGVSILFYLQKIFPDEWNNFLARLKCSNAENLQKSPELKEQLRLCASYRSQTLARTVRGIMQYQKALELQALVDRAKDEYLVNGPVEEHDLMVKVRSDCRLLSSMKWTYVISCQKYGAQKRAGDPRAEDILRLMTTYPSLRVAYIDEKESSIKGKKDYFSILVKGMPQNLDQVIYRIKLPGPAILCEGKPENQNHAIIFTRGEALQTIDMNQDNYLEEAFKMRNLLQEFHEKNRARKKPTILGLREHIFTGSVSSLAWFMSNQEMSFVTIGQRILAYPLRVRFHYGHPDIFDRIFHLNRGGISKSSKTINLSEDIFAGFNSTLRQGSVTHHEYIQLGKGRDVGLNQISMFEAKVANGNGEQSLCRDLYRLGHCFDFFRSLSCYFTTIGFYMSSLIIVLTVYIFLYGRIYLSFSGLEKILTVEALKKHEKALQAILAAQSFVQMGAFMVIPMMIELLVEGGLFSTISDMIHMQIQLAPLFFTFLLGIKSHYIGRTLLHGGAKYRPTGRGFVVYHAKFVDNYRLYARSHFVKGVELMSLLVIYHIYGHAQFLFTFSIWVMVISWLFSPFIFNPSGFDWHKIVEDRADWWKWIKSRGGIGVSQNESWESWWEEEIQHLRHTDWTSRIVEIVISLRFFVYQYGIVFHLNMTHTHSLWVYGLSWLCFIGILFVFKITSMNRWKVKFPLTLRFTKAIIACLILGALVALNALSILTMKDAVMCVLAFIPTGWGMILIAQVFRREVRRFGLWGSVRTLARVYEMMIGVIVFTPVAIFAWFPAISEFQTRLLFREAFSRGLHILRIIGGKNTLKED